jgi:hypothetical protein
MLEIMQGKSPYLLSTTSYLILQRPSSSVVEHLVYVQEVLGSNPSQATSFQGHMILNKTVITEMNAPALVMCGQTRPVLIVLVVLAVLCGCTHHGPQVQSESVGRAE